MKNVSELNKCANCGACYNVCPKKAISVDRSGTFYQITVDESKCIGCGRCTKVCPVNGGAQTSWEIRSAWMIENTDKDIVRKSSSGGAFSAIADAVISIGGTCYGAAFSDYFLEVMIRSNKKVGLDALRRSKYTESLVGYSFEEIKELLVKGETVLFSGTPCQVSGLKAYLGKEYPKLITADFVCGGCSSHKMYSEMLDQLQKKANASIESVNFRPKILGWGEHCIMVDFSNGRSYDAAASINTYFWSFLHRVSLREYCYECRFATEHRSDITLADFWQYKKCDLPPNDTGLSLVVVNTQKGEKLLGKCNPFLAAHEVDAKDVVVKQDRVPNANTMKARNLFLVDYEKMGLNTAAEKAGFPVGIKFRVEWMKYMVKKALYKAKHFRK